MCYSFFAAIIYNISLYIFFVTIIMALSGFLDDTHQENRVWWLLAEFHFHRYPMVVLVFKNLAIYQVTKRHVFC